jgi:hypothetical protein
MSMESPQELPSPLQEPDYEFLPPDDKTPITDSVSEREGLHILSGEEGEAVIDPIAGPEAGRFTPRYDNIETNDGVVIGVRGKEKFLLTPDGKITLGPLKSITKVEQGIKVVWPMSHTLATGVRSQTLSMDEFSKNDLSSLTKKGYGF